MRARTLALGGATPQTVLTAPRSSRGDRRLAPAHFTV
jgi:hypothetical protein